MPLEAGLQDKAGQVLRFDRAWESFVSRVPDDEALADMGDGELCETLDIDAAVLARAIPAALREWRISPSRSLVNCLVMVGEGVPEGAAFPSLVEQTRFLTMAANGGLLGRRSDVERAVDERGRPLRLTRDAFALTVTALGAAKANHVIRAFRAWELRNRARALTGRTRLPKALYRAVRVNDVRETTVAARDDRPNLHWWRDRIDAKREALSAVPLAETSHSPLLSFTENERVAEYFTRAEGFVVQVAPGDASVVASWTTDSGLDGADRVSGRHEREWILRIPRSLMLAPEDVRVHDADYLAAVGSPLCVALFRHNDRKARYRMRGREIEAGFSWNATGTNGGLWFSVDGGWPGSRAEARRDCGFDPLPSRRTLGEVENLRLYRVDVMGRTHPLDIPGREGAPAAAQ